MKKLTQAALLALTLLAAALPTAVQAQITCAGPFIEDGVVVYGEVRGTGHLGICARRPSGVIAFTNVPLCNVGTPIGQVFRVSGTAGWAGPSVIGPVVVPVNCLGTWIDPFPPAFQFGFWYTGLNGADIAYGTPNRDYLHGNGFAAGPVDGAPDTLCGYEDDDVLVGDLEPLPLPIACLNGGLNGAPGDQCHNGDKFDCEVPTGYGVLIPGDCGCGFAPPNIW